MSVRSLTPRRFLFLQGPHGPFFSQLARQLMDMGHHVRRINVNGGDKGDWDLPAHAEDYTGDLGGWPKWFEDRLDNLGITDVVFNGYWRPHHEWAIKICRRKGVTLHGFEEGLLRPNWITSDPRLPCEQAASFKKALLEKAIEDLHNPKPGRQSRYPHLKGANRRMYGYCMRYYINYFRHRRIFSGYRTHRLLSPWQETKALARQFLFYPLRKIAAERATSRMLREKPPFFVLCLQLEGDSQIRKYSGYRTMYEVMEETIANFAEFAPKDNLLFIKSHPLDNGTNNHEKNSAALAKKYGVADRVVFVWYGKRLAPMLRIARGMVAVNSTASASALAHGCPVKTLGQAYYNIPGLVDSRDWSHFLRKPLEPSQGVWQSLQAHLTEVGQIDGNFYAPSTYVTLVPDSIRSILARSGNIISEVVHSDESSKLSVVKSVAA